MSDLREQIAEILRRDGRGITSPTAIYRQAHAIVTELGLHQEWGLLDNEDSGTLYDERGQALAAHRLPGETLKSRWITNWEPYKPPYCNRCGKPCQALECLREDDR